jgi:uncharacterized protein (TIGR04255 family)
MARKPVEPHTLMVGSQELSTFFPQQEHTLPERTVPRDAAAIAADFTSPPIAEVSLAVVFQPIALGVVEAADLWRRHFAEEFPTVEEQAPLRLPQERFDGLPSSTPQFGIELVGTPSLPRLWFTNQKGDELVQVQNDWFARNWREGEGSHQPYPLYPHVREAFAADLAKFESFLSDNDLGPLRVIQAEVTYINHIDQPDLSQVLVAVSPVEGLPSPESVSFGYQYVLVEGGASIGRLHLQANKAVHRKRGEITVLTITARGRPLREGIEGALGFLDRGANEALSAFVKSTRPEMHQKWSAG